ncbi:MAG: hypothetical protein DRP54_01495 [Spirochaetes bacterium]|nr:MAG: hypothetical protein DRP54_01495 [Spirochaetota bacterium]
MSRHKSERNITPIFLSGVFNYCPSLKE